MRLPLPQFAPLDRPAHHWAEVIETATTEYLAQCLEPETLSFPTMPPFGSWVRSRDEDSGNQIYGIVYHATTAPIDSVHRAQALGLSLDDLREQQPQIFSMLKTEFRVAIVGFVPLAAFNPDAIGPEGVNVGAIASIVQVGAPLIQGAVYQHLPPRPPQIHQAVYGCDRQEVVEFTAKMDFLRTLLQMTGIPTDALIAATLREVYQLRQGDRAWLVQAGRTLSVLLKDDYDRLRAILSQVHL
jgi:hypothetical protein